MTVVVSGSEVASFIQEAVETPPEDPSIFERGFTMQPSAIFGPVAETSKALQVQEFHVLDDPADATKLIGWYSSWADAEATVSAIWRCTANKSDPAVWSNQTEILTAVDASIGYLRLSSVLYDEGAYKFYLTGDGDNVHIGTSDDGITITVSPTHALGEGSGHARLSVIRDGVNYWGVSGTASNLSYTIWNSADGLEWTEIGQILTPGVGSDSGGIEFASLIKVGNSYALAYEAYSGSFWATHLATADAPDGAWTKHGIILEKDAESNFATAHVATPTLNKINGTWYQFFQGSNTTSPQTGNGGPWSMGIATLNPA